MNSKTIYSTGKEIIDQPPAFFKPVNDDGFFFEQYSEKIKSTIRFRSLNLEKDLVVIHDWVTQPYTAKYWQMNVDPSELKAIYRSIINCPLTHSFVGTINDKIVCQIDCYHVSQEELNDHVNGEDGDCGLHILMLPPRESEKGLTEIMLRVFTQFYFSFEQANKLYGEPDIANQHGNIAAKKAGFHFLKTIQLSYKTANLYSITRSQFQSGQHDI